MRRPLRTTLTALGIGLFLALFDLFRTTVSRLMDGSVVHAHEVFRHLIPMWITIVIASPWCAFMARRFRFGPGRTARTLAAHLGGAAVFTALHLSMLMGYHVLAEGYRGVPNLPALLHTYLFYIAMEVSVYAAIVLIVMLLESQREAAERELAAARLAQHATAARLESLQAQIQPHFLFNTLNALAVLARKGDGAAVDRAIGDLGELLRAQFDGGGRHEITLGEELDFLERYVGLQRIRFPDRLSVEWEVTEEARVARVPPLTVQPLVENAIEHGLSTLRGGRVRVTARRDGEMLEIDVTDDGPGFRRASLNAKGGMGLANTRERLALLYGARGTLECSDLLGGGGRVRMRLPWRVDDGKPVA